LNIIKLKLTAPHSQFETACNRLKARRTCEGYQTTQNIIDQSTRAIDICDEDYADEKHVLAYDNATIHTARAANALSAAKMTTKPSDNFNKVKDDNGSTHLVCMHDGVFHNGAPQSLPVQRDENNHPRAPCKGSQPLQSRCS
jgi:hypothetical protein